jgi:hypothetical protein
LLKPFLAFKRGNGDDKTPHTPGDIAKGFKPKVFDLKILDTTTSGLTLSALVNITNPTVYYANIPYVDILIRKNGSTLGHATARDLAIGPGENSNLYVTAVYDPLTNGGANATAIGRELISQYISGYNTTLTLQTHNGTLPTLPGLGHALSKFAIDMPAPRLHTPSPPRTNPDDPTPTPPPKDGKDEGPHFIHDATFHLLTSTATFLLTSPFRTETLYVTSIDATAYYKNSEAGRIIYDLPFAVPPVDEDGNGVMTPRLPVEWSLGSVGYDAVKRALGGRLKLSAYAEVGVRVGKWEENVWFRGKGIGASVRI